MKNLLFAAAIIATTFFSCANKTEEKATETIEIKSLSLASDKDPVCGMSVKEKVGDTTVYNGKTYGFCNPGCKTEFKKNPSQYVKE